MSDLHPENLQVLVVGAGIAGLAAARVLAERRLRTVVLEARERLGGRILTRYPEEAHVPVELGAEFIHGQPPELLALLKEAGLAIYEAEGEQVCYEHGRLRACGDDEAFALLEGLREEEDISFDAYLAKSGAPEPAKARARQFVEGFNAADAARIGTAGLARQQAAEDAIEGDRAWRVTEGYQALVDYLEGRLLAAGGEIRRNTPVASVRWHLGQVAALTRSGEEVRAAKAVITLPLGVLQSGSVFFEPRPESFSALDGLAMGPVQRLVLVFRERFWARETENMHFLFARDQTPGVWWTTAPRQSTVLTGWIGGPRALAFRNSDDLLAQALASLEHMYALASW